MVRFGFLLPTLWNDLSPVKAVLVHSYHTPLWNSMSAEVAVLAGLRAKGQQIRNFWRVVIRATEK